MSIWKSMKQLVIDIETNSALNHIWCCVCQDVTSGEVWVYTSSEGLSDLFKSYDKIIGHNIIGFDGPKLSELWGVAVPASKAVDTLVLSRLLNPVREGGHSLRSWGIELSEHKLDFDDYDGGLTDEMLTYCKKDVAVTVRLYSILTKRLAEWKQPEKAIDLEHQVAIICAKQERNGFKFNSAEAEILHAKLVDRMATIEDQMQEVFSPIVEERWSEKTGKRLKDKVTVFNPGSRQQISERLQGLGWKPKQFTETGQPKVDETILSGIEMEEAQLIGEYLMIQKRVGLLDSWLKNATSEDRIHGGIITIGTITGRMAHRNPNLGQVPSVSKPYGIDCRSLFTVDKGNCLVGSDLSGIELRCLAHYMADAEWTKELLNGDIHTKNQQAAGLETRAQAKTMQYAVLYGAGPAKVGSIVGGGAREGQEILTRFFDNTPSLKDLMDRVRAEADQGYVIGLDGRRIFVRNDYAALNSLLQGCGAIIAKQWCVEAHQTFKKRRIPVKQVAFVHDEIQIETEERFSQEVADIMVSSALKAGNTLGFLCPIEAESKIGHNWYETH